MDEAIFGEQERLEHRVLSRAARLHGKLASFFETRGLRRQANEELEKLSIVNQVIGSLVKKWEPSGKCFTAANREDVYRWQKLLREHAGLSGSVATDIAKNLIRSGRDLPSLARQKGWDMDGTALAVGVWKIMKIMGYPQDATGEFLPMSGNTDDDQALIKLQDLAKSVGVDEELVQDAKDFMLEEELEEEWARHASSI